MEKMPKIVLPISLQFDISIDWNLWQNKPCCYVFSSYWCQPIAMSNKKWADMGTFNTEWIGWLAFEKNANHSKWCWSIQLGKFPDMLHWKGCK